MTPEQRSLQARAAVLASWANTEDRAARTRPGNQALLARFDDQVDPERKLPEPERARRAEAARRAYFSSLALRSSQVRARRKNARSKPPAPEPTPASKPAYRVNSRTGKRYRLRPRS